MKNALHYVLTASEFWVIVGEAAVELSHADLPAGATGGGWAYVAARVAKKLATFFIPRLLGMKASPTPPVQP